MGQAISKECCGKKKNEQKKPQEETDIQKDNNNEETPIKQSKSRRIVSDEKEIVFQFSKAVRNLRKVEGQKEEYSTKDQKFYSPNYFKITTDESAKPVKKEGDIEIYECKYNTDETEIEERESWSNKPMRFGYDDDFDRMLGDFHNDRYQNKFVVVSNNSNVILTVLKIFFRLNKMTSTKFLKCMDLKGMVVEGIKNLEILTILDFLETTTETSEGWEA